MHNHQVVAEERESSPPSSPPPPIITLPTVLSITSAQRLKKPPHSTISTKQLLNLLRQRIRPLFGYRSTTLIETLRKINGRIRVRRSRRTFTTMSIRSVAIRTISIDVAMIPYMSRANIISRRAFAIVVAVMMRFTGGSGALTTFTDQRWGIGTRGRRRKVEFDRFSRWLGCSSSFQRRARRRLGGRRVYT